MLTLGKHPKRKGKILQFDITKKLDHTDFIGIFQNTGEIHIKATASVVIRDSSNRVWDRIQLSGGTGTLLPEGKRKYTGEWRNRRKLEPGHYFAEIRMQFPGNREIRKEVKEFIVTK